MSNNVKIGVVYDPRISVGSTLLDNPSGNIHFLIEKTCQSINYYNQTADTTATSNLSWNNVPLTSSTGTSSQLIVTIPVRLNFVAAAGSTGNLIIPNGDAPRSSILMKNGSSINLSLNGQTLSESTRYYYHAVCHYGAKYETLLNRYSNFMRSCLDNNYKYTIGDNNCVLNQYGNASVVTGVMPRGSFLNNQYAIIANSPTAATVDVLYTEVVPISLFNIQDYPKYCIPGIKTLTLQINLNPEIKFLWSHSPDSGSIINESLSSIQIGGNSNACIYGTQATLYYQSYVLPTELTFGQSPDLLNYVYPYYYTNNFTDVQSGAPLLGPYDPTIPNVYSSTDIATKTVTPQGYPKKIYVWCEIADGDRDVTTPYYFLPIQQITINFANKQNTLTSITPITGQPVNPWLYQLIASKNGCKIPFSQFRNTPVYCITCEDLNLDAEEFAGQSQQSNLSINATISNITPYTINNVVFNTCIVYEGAILYNGAAGGGNFSVITNIVKPNFLNNARIEPNSLYYIAQDHDYLGGLSIRDIVESAKHVASKGLEFAKRAAPYVIPAAAAAVPYVSAALPYAVKYGPKAIELLSKLRGKGQLGGCDIEGADFIGGRRRLSCGRGDLENSLLEGCQRGTGLIGGRRMPRESLRNRMAKY